MNRVPTLAMLRSSTLAALAAALPGCTQLERIDDGSGGAGIPDEVQRAFDDSCAFAGCHDAASQQAGLDLSAAAAPAIIGGAAMQSDLPLVELGNVQGSYLALKLLPNPPTGVRMPSGIMPGVDNAIILGWIAGAELPGGGAEGSTTDLPGTTTEPAEGSSTGSTMRLCGVEDVVPSAVDPFDIGMDAGQIPPDVGAVLSNNCGCHESDEPLVMGAPPYGGSVHFSTIAELQAEYTTFVMGSSMMLPGHEILLARVQAEDATRMPPAYYCDLGDGTVIADADRQLLIDWLGAGAPDAPTWMQ